MWKRLVRWRDILRNFKSSTYLSPFFLLQFLSLSELPTHLTSSALWQVDDSAPIHRPLFLSQLDHLHTLYFFLSTQVGIITGHLSTYLSPYNQSLLSLRKHFICIFFPTFHREVNNSLTQHLPFLLTHFKDSAQHHLPIHISTHSTRHVTVARLLARAWVKRVWDVSGGPCVQNRREWKWISQAMSGIWRLSDSSKLCRNTDCLKFWEVVVCLVIEFGGVDRSSILRQC